jgi:ABC-type nitrate/sulfonate/bicarbonate transport system substrate-binding protein
MNKSRTYLITALAFAVLATLLAYLALRPPAPPPRPPGPPEKVTIAYSATTDSVLPVVAQVMGYYQQEGLQVVPHLHPYGKLALNELLEGKADFATVAETPFMLAVMKGAKISVLATIQTTGRNHAIIARKDRGISSPGDLKGRKIGVTPGTTADFFMDTFLAVHEIARKDMKVVDLNPGAQAAALARGDVDAVSAFKPFSLQVQKTLGERGTVFFDEHIYTFMFNVVATQKFISENPGKVRKLLRALIQAERYVERHQAEAQKAVADFCEMEPALVREICPDFSYSVKLDQSLVLALEEETRWAITEGLVDTHKMPDYLDYIYLEALEQIRPKSVRILR